MGRRIFLLQRRLLILELFRRNRLTRGAAVLKQRDHPVAG
jgi:hypothetical protein